MPCALVFVMELRTVLRPLHVVAFLRCGVALRDTKNTKAAADATAAAQALDLGFGEIERIEQVFSAVRQGSVINEINQYDGSRPVEVSLEVMSVLQWAGGVRRGAAFFAK